MHELYVTTHQTGREFIGIHRAWPAATLLAALVRARIRHMAVIRQQDLVKGREAWHQWREAATRLALAAGDDDAVAEAGSSAKAEAQAEGQTATPADAASRLAVHPDLPRPIWAMAVRYTLFLLERRAPGEGVEVRVAPWGAIKILEGPASDPHNLTPPDVIELDPDVWLRLAAGITAWDEEKDAGRISAVGERDDLSDLLPL